MKDRLYPGWPEGWRTQSGLSNISEAQDSKRPMSPIMMVTCGNENKWFNCKYLKSKLFSFSLHNHLEHPRASLGKQWVSSRHLIQCIVEESYEIWC